MVNSFYWIGGGLSIVVPSKNNENWPTKSDVTRQENLLRKKLTVFGLNLINVIISIQVLDHQSRSFNY